VNELKVGLLSLLAIASIVVVSLKITSNKATFGDFIEYKTILSDATGIYENSSIKVAGIVAGRIKTITLSGSQALIKFEVLEKIKITQFSRLRIKSVGFLGDKYIDIYLGDPDAPRLKEGSFIKAETGAGFEQLGKDASEILKDVKVITKVIKESLYTEDKKNAIKQIVGQINEFSHNANAISKSLREMIQGNQGKLNKTIDNLEKLTSQLAYETNRYEEGSFMEDLSDMGPILAKVDQSVTDLRDIMADVKSGKGTVGKLLRDEQIVDQVNETLSGVNQIVGRLNRFKANVSIFTGANNMEGAKTQLDLELMPSPERFFRFGIVLGDGTILRQEVTTTTTVDDGDPTVTNEVIEDDALYRFNLQIGRQVNRYGLRVGLIESTGGLGVDYFIPEWGLKTSYEGFDYREDIGLNSRLTAELRLWSVFHAQVMASDVTRAEEYRVYTISAGLKFSDEDLSALIGFAL
tara:strand:- start:14621 stop:16015 length:1395 start_codon:yes stop_codon:yes gene_type:complete